MNSLTNNKKLTINGWEVAWATSIHSDGVPRVLAHFRHKRENKLLLVPMEQTKWAKFGPTGIIMMINSKAWGYDLAVALRKSLGKVNGKDTISMNAPCWPTPKEKENDIPNKKPDK